MQHRGTTLKALFAGLALLCFAAPATAQTLLFGWDTLPEDSVFWNGRYYGNPRTWADPSLQPYMDYAPFEAAQPTEGTGALQIDWQVFAWASWGGSNGIQHFRAPSRGFLDISDYKYIKLDYFSLMNGSQPTPFRLKLHDAGDATLNADSSGWNNMEDWYQQAAEVFNPTQPGAWHTLTIPLVSRGSGTSPDNTGYQYTGWSGFTGGNHEFDMNKIVGMTLEWTVGALTGDSVTFGTTAFDNLRLSGNRFGLVEGFDENITAKPGFSKWDGTGTSSLVLTQLGADQAADSTGALRMQWNLKGSESWGGGQSFTYKVPGGGFLETLADNTHLSLFFQNEAVSSVPGGVEFRIILIDNSDGVEEKWIYQTKAVMDSATVDWTRLLIPLQESIGNPNDQGFLIPSWDGNKGNGKLDLDKIVGWTIELTSNVVGLDASGVLLLDRFSPYGFRETDNVAPAAVTGLDVLPGENKNIISWEDVPGETNETYTVYFSENPITDVTAPGVKTVATGVARGTQVVEHMLYAPNADRNVSFYYAITATDKAQNTSQVSGTTSALTNMAKALVPISLVVPTNFVADGALTDWAGITPIHISGAGPIGHTPVSFLPPENDADLSADVYLAMDAENLYFVLDVSDDTYKPVPDDVTSNRWEYDGAELYLGLYDSKGAGNKLYGTKEQPDYKFNIYKQVFRLDVGSGTDLFASGDPNYIWTPTATGWRAEGKIPFSSFSFATAPVFEPKEGMMIPLDIVLMDREVSNRESVLSYSPNNNDNSWSSPANWFYTYLGNEMFVRTADENGGSDLPQRYALGQNYPNPFNPTTAITFALVATQHVTIKVYNLIGQEVATLIDAQMAAGDHTVRFDARELPTGVYIYQIKAGSFVSSKKMVLVR